MPRITILIPCYNEEANIEPLYEEIDRVLRTVPGHEYAILFADNGSTDGSRAILRRLAAKDPRVLAIFNIRNFGYIRSSFHALIEAPGDAVILMAADFQDPPELLPRYIQEWENGAPLAMGIKNKSEEWSVFYRLRTLYYRVLNSFSEVPLNENSTGSGLYSRPVIDALRKLREPYPYLRGLICELGFPIAKVPFTQPVRRRGITKNNFYSLYDLAMLGFVSHSKVPLRLAIMFGFAMAGCSFLLSIAYLVLKLVFWERFAIGFASLIIGIFFLSSVQLIFIGILGEYIGAIHTKVSDRPLVVEAERLNF